MTDATAQREGLREGGRGTKANTDSNGTAAVQLPDELVATATNSKAVEFGKEGFMRDHIVGLFEVDEQSKAVEIEEVVSVRFIPPEYHLKYRDDGQPGRIANIDLVHEHVQLVIDDPESAKVQLNLQESEDCPTAPTG